MTTQRKWILGSVALILAAAVAVLGILWAKQRMQEAAVLDAWYQEMTCAMVVGHAGERAPDHPMARLYLERRDALVKAGYLKTRQFPLRHKFDSSRASWSFLVRFATNFPGVDRKLQTKPGQPPVLIVTARDHDLPAIKLFILQNDTGP